MRFDARLLAPVPAEIPSPDLNLIEWHSSKLKAHLRKAAARTYDTLCSAIGDVCNLFTPDECWNFFKAQNYVAD
ncbi:MAG: hypothetical protein R3C51_06160 [Parvularculaceae bacterium]